MPTIHHHMYVWYGIPGIPGMPGQVQSGYFFSTAVTLTQFGGIKDKELLEQKKGHL